MATTPKKPWVAFLLSILLTGAGLAYLGTWGWAVLNLLAAIVAVAIAGYISPDLAAPVGIGIACGSAVLAKNMAQKMNQELAARSVSAPPNGTPISVAPAPVLEANPASKPPQPVRVNPTSILCTKCGTMTEMANFCAECGAPLAPA